MRVILVISFVVCSLLLEGQQSKVDFIKSPAYKVSIDINEGFRTLDFSYSREKLQIVLPDEMYSIKFDIRGSDLDTVIEINFTLKSDTTIKIDRFILQKITMLEDVDIFDQG